ncbi:hypothetical protein A374_08684 [Fictibacillus macauensis ZFHKF-1]|uniref:Uncharacterized protein n=1 Tax=Fictibacillus macauensis ZFHKF-1 TaxID=1196324 RepID=I8UGE2_9BACL|nr:hypothetical protein [Fictibacillus macauensis]EIT85898.1 hypothetical protein A374_08684 [Fictibacillus macauensis ZFHKF-1]
MRQITAVEIIVTYVSLGWAVALFSNPRLFSGNTGSWGVMDSVADEWIFGVITLTLALIKIVGIALDNIKIRKMGLILSAVFWVFVSVCLLVGNDHINWNTGAVAYSGYGILCLWMSKEVGAKNGGADKRSLK